MHRARAALRARAGGPRRVRAGKGDFWVSARHSQSVAAVHGKITVTADEGTGVPQLACAADFAVELLQKDRFAITQGAATVAFQHPSRAMAPNGARPVFSADFNAGGLGVCGGGGGDLRVWNTATGGTERALQGHVGDISVCRFFPSGQVVLSAAADLRLKIWSAASGDCPVTLTGHSRRITDVSFVERGKNVLSCSKDGSLKLWDCGSSTCIATA